VKGKLDPGNILFESERMWLERDAVKDVQVQISLKDPLLWYPNRLEKKEGL
jgi:hypothetical protein